MARWIATCRNCGATAEFRGDHHNGEQAAIDQAYAWARGHFERDTHRSVVRRVDWKDDDAIDPS